ncbi:SdrD B-like domain-containing protein, partial [Arthrospira platensis SPKY2]
MAGGKIGDTIWRDWNGDGVQDPGEEGIAGVTVRLFAADGVTELASTTTDANGNYFFPGLEAATYVVEVNGGAAPTNTTLTGDPDGTLDNRHTVTLAENQQYLTADFGYQ